MAEHGELSKYTNEGCRCELCRAANAAWQREYRKGRLKCPRCGGLRTARFTHCYNCRKELREESRQRDKQAKEHKPKPKRQFDQWPLEVVNGEELAAILDQWVEQHSGNNQILAQRTGVDESSIRRIRIRTYQYVSAYKADVLLVAIGRSLNELQVVPNPRLSQEVWLARMKERGCEFDA